MPATGKTRQIVWVRDGGRCAKCRSNLLLEDDSGKLAHLVGDIAHIVGEQSFAARGESDMSNEERNAEGNLILLCKQDHKLIDDDPITYSVTALKSVAMRHKEWVRANLTDVPKWTGKLIHLQYINVPRLALLASTQGLSLDLSRYGSISALHDLGWELNGLMFGFQQILSKMSVHAIPIEAALQKNDPVGTVVSFDTRFRTKNIRMPGPGEAYRSSFTGNPDKDPHIYAKISGYKCIANIDERWITTTTAFCNFRPSSGANKFGGFGFLTSVDQEHAIAYVTPYLLGLPSNPHLEAFYAALDGQR